MIDVEKYIDIKTKGVDMIINQTGGSAPVIETLNVTPSTQAQTITAPQGTDGYNPVNVSAVTSSIDANITASNIKSGVTILGTTGNVIELDGETTSVTPTTSQQTITPTSPHNGLTSVTVDAVTSSIDANITAGNIKSGVSILGVSGSVTELNGSTTTINPSTSEQIVSPTSPSNGFTSVTVPAVTASIDANIVAENIKKDVTILGVTGILEGGSAPAYYVEKTKDANNVLNNTANTIIDLTGVTDIGNSVLHNAYYGSNYNGNAGDVDFSSLKKLTGSSALMSAFQNCKTITSINLSGLEYITGSSCFQNTFYGCSSLTSANVSSLWGVLASSQSCFRDCKELTSLDFGSVLVIKSYGAFQYIAYGCTKLASINLSRVCKIENNLVFSNAFQNTAITSLSFPNLAYTATDFNSALNGMLTGCSNITVHFPAEWQTTMSSWSNVTNGFGGTNTTVLFDLPNVTTLDLSTLKHAELTEVGGITKNNYFPNITSVNLSGLTTVSGSGTCHSMFSNYIGLTSVNLSSLTSIEGSASCAYMFYGCTGITSVSLSSLTTINGQSSCSDMFEGCTGVTGTLNLSSLTTISGQTACSLMFLNCSGITSVDLSGLTSVTGGSACQSMFSGCTGITSADLSSLTTVSGGNAFSTMFMGCTSLTSVDLSSLESLSENYVFNSTFKNCTSLTTLSFPALKTVSSSSVFYDTLNGVTGCTVHFPSNLSSYNFILGGTGTTVLYDLPATE